MRVSVLFLSSLFMAFPLLGQNVAITQDSAVSPAATSSVVPHLIRHAGFMPEAPSGASVVQIRFALYQAQSGGQPLWTETQEVSLDAAGKYSVLLGSSEPGGMPHQLFAGGEARWLGVTLSGGAEQSRTLLAATPYSLKASDAETLAGHPASDFVLSHKAADGKPQTVTDITTIQGGNGVLVDSKVNGSGTGPTVTLGLDGTYLATLGNSTYAQLHAANTFTGNQTIKGNLTVTGSGIVNNIVAGAAVDVSKNGGTYTIGLDGAQASSFGNELWAQLASSNTFKGQQTLAALNSATASTEYNSNALKLSASAYNSTVTAPEAINYFWQAEPSGNNTSAPSGSLSLLFSTGGNAAAETGLKIGATGKITFAGGQTFPGAGVGTITGVTAGTGLTGGGTSGTVTLNVNAPALETTYDARYPRLAAANTFTSANVFNAGLTSSGAITAKVTSASSIAVSGSSTSASGTGVVGSFQSDGSTQGGVGVEGNTGAISTTGSTQIGEAPGVGVWADTNHNGAALLATLDDGNAIEAYNDSSYATAYFFNLTTDTGEGGYLLTARSNDGGCELYVNGDLACTGNVTGVTPVRGRELKTYTMQTAEDWFEDAGTAQLSGGAGHVSLDADVAQIVESSANYHVFLTPDGDCKGLYVAGKTAEGFDVREIGGGKSSVGFEYRIMAIRRNPNANVDNSRLADVTNRKKPAPAGPAHSMIATRTTSHPLP